MVSFFSGKITALLTREWSQLDCRFPGRFFLPQKASRLHSSVRLSLALPPISRFFFFDTLCRCVVSAVEITPQFLKKVKGFEGELSESSEIENGRERKAWGCYHRKWKMLPCSKKVTHGNIVSKITFFSTEPLIFQGFCFFLAAFHPNPTPTDLILG